MSASRRAPKPRYVFTQDRDRIALVAGALCAVIVMAISIIVQRHAMLETVFRALVALLVTYAAVYVAVVFAQYLRETQSTPDAAPKTEVEDSETE